MSSVQSFIAGAKFIEKMKIRIEIDEEKTRLSYLSIQLVPTSDACSSLNVLNPNTHSIGRQDHVQEEFGIYGLVQCHSHAPQTPIHGLLIAEISEKLNAMNYFRKNQRDFEKKYMHAVLTDLNKKVEAINERSSEYLRKLQLCIQLGKLGAQNPCSICLL